MHFYAFVAALLLPFVACRDAGVKAGGDDCASTCYGLSCLTASALWTGVAGPAGCELTESWGCDCTGCDCADSLDIGTIENVPDDYGCAPTEYGGGLSCDEMAYYGFGCHYMETRRGADCSGCLCEEAVLDYVKGDGSCPVTCVGENCNIHTQGWNVFSCEALETFDWVMGCDCSGCSTCDSVAPQEGWSAVAYNGMDCNGNGYWSVDTLGNAECDEEIGSFTLMMGSPDTGYTEQSWYTCTNCPELECDMGDCGASCERGDTCALPLCELCADENSVVTPTQYGRAQYCTEDSYTCAPSATPTEAPTGAPSVTEATVAEEDGANTITTFSAAALALVSLVAY